MGFAGVIDRMRQWKICLDFDLLKQFSIVVLKKKTTGWHPREHGSAELIYSSFLRWGWKLCSPHVVIAAHELTTTWYKPTHFLTIMRVVIKA